MPNPHDEVIITVHNERLARVLVFLLNLGLPPKLIPFVKKQRVHTHDTHD
jgi:hypothetical protein